MRLLTAVPQSVLWLRQPAPDARVTLEQEAATRGVDPARLVYADTVPLDMHLARHQLADLFLDTLPYGAHATAADALCAGLPVLTCRGQAFAGRVAASLLVAAELPELIAENLTAYEAKALALARDSNALASLKEKLKQKLVSAPLFDAGMFRRALEEAFVIMHKQGSRGQQ
jgi:predicted O-linked N-acetylglucosamine transferase (SPINDLY family)